MSSKTCPGCHPENPASRERDRCPEHQTPDQWKERALRAEGRLGMLTQRLTQMDTIHAEGFNAGAKSGRNEAYTTVAQSLDAHAQRLIDNGGVVEAACARVLKRAANNIRHHIEPINPAPREEAS